VCTSALTVRDRGERGRVGRLPLPHAALAGGGRSGDEEQHHADAEEDVHGDGAEPSTRPEEKETVICFCLAHAAAT
jgi:hypothetical protein